MSSSEPSSVREPEYVSTIIPDSKTNKPVRHVLRFPPEGTEELLNSPLPLGCEEDTLVFGRRRQVVPVSKINCPKCRELTGW